MLNRVILFLVFLLTLSGMFLLSQIEEHLGMLVTPVPIFFLVLFLFPQYRSFFFPALGFFFVYISLKILTSDAASKWFLIQGATSLLPLAGFSYISRFWRHELQSLQENTQCVKKITDEIARGEHESLREQDRLDKQVSEIVGLFELAREFNECIDVKDIVKVLSKQVFSLIPFERLRLIFLDEGVISSEMEQSEIILQGQVPQTDQEKVRELSLEREAIDLFVKKKGISRFDTPEEDRERLFERYTIRYPLWIFPLVVGGEVTALFWVEGARVEDFGKFEIIASQLALHVKKVKLYNEVKELSIVDGLTQLFVRRHFLERLRDELFRSVRYRLSLVVMLLDIDQFKQYNDTYGHLVGDVALRQVAQTVKEVIRRVDIAGRYGGEEFVVALPETDKVGGLDAGERIRSRIAKKVFRAYDEDTKLTVSIGISLFPGKLENSLNEGAIDQTVNLLLKQADEALYQAKEEGRNRVVVCSG